jgi:8-oxo-dGTP diphosphatase
MKKPRNSAKAVIIRDGQLLVIKKREGQNDWYILPGGGQEKHETLHQALKREVLEEAGLEAEIGELLFVREYLSANHEFSATDTNTHQVEFMFEVRVKADAKAAEGHHPDENQVGVEWLPLAKLEKYDLYPKALIPRLKDLDKKFPIYLGDVN